MGISRAAGRDAVEVPHDDTSTGAGAASPCTRSTPRSRAALANVGRFREHTRANVSRCGSGQLRARPGMLRCDRAACRATTRPPRATGRGQLVAVMRGRKPHRRGRASWSSWSATASTVGASAGRASGSGVEAGAAPSTGCDASDPASVAEMSSPAAPTIGHRLPELHRRARPPRAASSSVPLSNARRNSIVALSNSLDVEGASHPPRSRPLPFLCQVDSTLLHGGERVVGIDIERRLRHREASFKAQAWPCGSTRFAARTMRSTCGRQYCSSLALYGIGTSSVVTRRTGASRSSHARRCTRSEISAPTPP